MHILLLYMIDISLYFDNLELKAIFLNPSKKRYNYFIFINFPYILKFMKIKNHIK